MSRPSSGASRTSHERADKGEPAICCLRLRHSCVRPQQRACLQAMLECLPVKLILQGPRRVFWSVGLNRSRKGESSSVMPGAPCSPGKIWKFKSSEMAANGSCKQIYIDKKLLNWLEMHLASSCTLTKDTSKTRKN